MDTLLSPILDSLRVCLCTALADTLGGEPGCGGCAIVSGDRAFSDSCGCGQTGTCGKGWVRLDRIYPSGERFPGQDATTRGGCARVLAAVIEVGVDRCIPVMDARGNPPDATAVTQAALVAADDALALFRTIGCCEQVTKRAHLLGAYVPRSGGDCGGGFVTVTVQLTRL